VTHIFLVLVTLFYDRYRTNSNKNKNKNRNSKWRQMPGKSDFPEIVFYLKLYNFFIPILEAFFLKKNFVR